jgi:hypothetical protein
MRTQHKESQPPPTPIWATEVGCPAPPLFGRLQGCFEGFFWAFEGLFEGPAPGVIRLLHQSVRALNGLQRSVEGLSKESTTARAR